MRGTQLTLFTLGKWERAHGAPATCGEIARVLGMSRQGVWDNVQRLRRSGLVTEQSRWKAHREARLTEAGWAQHARLEQEAEAA